MSRPEQPDTTPSGEWSADEADLLRGLFIDEAQGHLHHIAEAQATLARAPDDAVPADAVDALFRHLHSLKGAAGSVGFEAIGRSAHELEELISEIRQGHVALTAGILERLDEGVGHLRALLEGARMVPSRSRPSSPSQPGSQEGSLEGRGPGEPARRRDDRRPGVERRRSTDRMLRVASERLDALLDGVGDLVILRTRVERRLRELEGVLRDLNGTRTRLRTVLGALGESVPNTPAAPTLRGPGDSPVALLDRLSEVELEFADVVAHMDRAARALGAETESLRRTSDQLDEQLRRARLVPLDWVFQRLNGALRELERSAGRRAEMVVHGGDLEVDKSVAEQLSEPLLHLLRNALAHGIEPPAVRQARGKPPRGHIQVSARLEGEVVYIVFQDDGGGIDREGVRQALVRRGRLAPGAPLREDALLLALFEPGFSSRAEANALAGRGMGLNIVKRAIMRLGGELAVEYQTGTFTRFRLTVPLTAAITQALLFKVGGQVYAVPAAHVVEALPLGPDDLLVKGGGLESVTLRRAGGPPIPILRLHAVLGVEIPPGRRAAALHVRYGDRRFILTCDKVIGPRTIVVRPLGPLLGLLPLYAGVTVSGAGKAQLVLDLAALTDAAHAPARPIAVPASRRGQARVLVVDDSRLSREAATRVLAAAGHQVITAEDGWEAWETLSERRFDAVVTDLEMPRVDGFELIARIRRDATVRHLPVVVLSSRTAKATRDRALRAGADAVLPKGPHKRALAETVAHLLAHRGERRESAG
jgi:chemotaxis protein histidine kinase CheA